MKGAVQIARIFDIPVRLHWSFGLLLLLPVYAGVAGKADPSTILIQSAFLLVLFFCVLLHEFGHALTARRFGVQTQDIILLPIGGIARLNRLPEQPLQELLVALAGPAVNFGIALLLFPLWRALGEGSPWIIQSWLYAHLDAGSMLLSLIQLNVLLGVFNLVPAFPMDGGRILRALMAIPFGRFRATQIAVRIGQGMAVLLIAFAIWKLDPVAAFVGIFVFVTAAGEYQTIRYEQWLQHITTGAVCRRNFAIVSPDTPLALPAEKLLRGEVHHFVVQDENGEPTGILTEEQVQNAMEKNDLQARVAEYYQSGCRYLPHSATLQAAWQDLQSNAATLLLITDAADNIIGTLDADQIHGYIHLQQRLKGQIPQLLPQNMHTEATVVSTEEA